MTRLEAQVKLGLFAPHDIVTLILVLGSWIGTGIWYWKGDPSLLQIAVLLLLSLNLVALWIVVLAFRILVFILDMSADMHLRPETASRMAVAYLQGRAPSPTPPSGPPKR